MVFHGFCPRDGVRKPPKIDENTVPKIIRKKKRKKSENGGLEARFWELFGDFLVLVLQISFLSEKKVPPTSPTSRVNGVTGGFKEAT